MKSLSFTLLFLMIGGLSSGCFLTREIVVDYDYDYRGEFKDYNSFAFVNDISTNKLHQNQDLHLDMVEEYIESRLGFMGYKKNDRRPDLYIATKIFYSDLELNGYNQPDIYLWVENPGWEPNKYDKVRYNLKEGTIYVTFIDRRKQQTVWRGYASGIFGSQDFDNGWYVRESVKRILDNYRFLAEADSIYITN